MDAAADVALTDDDDERPLPSPLGDAGAFLRGAILALAPTLARFVRKVRP